MRHSFSRFSAVAIVAACICSDGWADTEAGRFGISRYEVIGNTLLLPQTVNDLLAPYVGTASDFGTVQRALEALEAAYHKRGFNMVQVILPEQELNQGVVSLRVIEPKLGLVTVEGNKVFDYENIRHSLPGLREGQTPNIGEISTSLRLANEHPSKKTTLQMQGGEKEDEINALLKVVDEKTWKAGLSFDNTGNDKTGRTHVGVSYQNTNISGHDDTMSLQYTTTLEKPQKVSVYGVGYHVPLYGVGDSIDIYGSYSDVDSGSVAVGSVNLLVSGKGSVLGAHYNQNLGRFGNYEPKLIYGIDYKAFKNSATLEGTQLGNEVTVHPLSLSYSGLWTLPNGQAAFSVTAIRNIPGGSKGRGTDFEAARPGSSANYSMLRMSANYSRVLPLDWQLRLNFSGQYSQNLLVPGEQFGAGGGSSVRGFLEREISNDIGYMTSAEIYTPNLCAMKEGALAQCRILAFYDAAYVSKNKTLVSPESGQASIGSVGLGVRLAKDNALSLQVDVGYVVDSGETQLKGDKRMHFTLGLSF